MGRVNIYGLLAVIVATMILCSSLGFEGRIFDGGGAITRDSGGFYDTGNQAGSPQEGLQPQQGFDLPETRDSGPDNRDVRLDGVGGMPKTEGGVIGTDGTTFEINVTYNPPGCPGGACWVHFEVVTDIPGLIFFRWDMNDDGIWDTPWLTQKYVDMFFSSGFNLTVCVGAWDGFSVEIQRISIFHETPRVEHFLSPADSGWMFKSDGDYTVSQLGYWRETEDYPGLYIGIWRMPDGLLMGSCTPLGVTDNSWQWCTLSSSIHLVKGDEYLVGFHKSIEGAPYWTAVDANSLYFNGVEYEGYYHSWDSGFPGLFGGMNILPKCNFGWMSDSALVKELYTCTHCENDTGPPVISDVTATPNPQDVHHEVNISASIIDGVEIAVANVSISSPSGTTNSTMALDDVSGRYYHVAVYHELGDYTFTIWASDSFGNRNSSSGSFSIVDRTPPLITHIPVGLNYVGSGTSIIAKVTDNFHLQEVRLNYLDSSLVSHNVTMAAISQDGFSTVIPSPYHAATINYFIWAIDSEGNSAMTSTYMIRYHLLAPSPPSNLAVAPDGYAALRLSWDKPTSNIDGTPLADLAGYNVYRMIELNGTRLKVNVDGLVNAATFTDINGLEDDKTYYYVVTAVNSWGNESAESNEASGTTLARATGYPSEIIVLALVIVAVAAIVLFLLMRRRMKREGESEGGADSGMHEEKRKSPPKGS